MPSSQIGRRAFLTGSTLLLAGGVFRAGNCSHAWAAEEELESAVKLGLITDLHYANKETAGTRHYRDTPKKLTEAAAKFRDEKVSFVVELGDLIDSAPSFESEMENLTTINRQLTEQIDKRHFVLGNHCVERLTKQEFLAEVKQERSYYSFDQAGTHFVILDACFRSDGVPYGRKNSIWTDAFIPPEEVRWLQEDLAATELPTVVFAHQRLDVENHYAPKNVKEIRSVLEASNKVSAVFQGHSHKNDYKEINGIHYCTLVAMIEGTAPDNNGYSILNIHKNGSLALAGFRKQKNQILKQSSRPSAAR